MASKYKVFNRDVFERDFIKYQCDSTNLFQGIIVVLIIFGSSKALFTEKFSVTKLRYFLLSNQ